MSPKNRASLIEKVNRIELDQFSEADLENLLISIREYVGKKTLVRELGDFIAHPERDKGLFYDELAWRAAVVKYKFPVGKSLPINIFSMPISDYDVLFNISIRKINDKIWIKEYGLNQRDITSFINKSYEFDKAKRCYNLVNLGAIHKIHSIILTSLRVLSNVPIASIEDFVTSLEKELSTIFKSVVHNYSYNNAVKRHARHVALCLISLMQGMTFKLFDGSLGQLSIGLRDVYTNYISDVHEPNAALVLEMSFSISKEMPTKIYSNILSSKLLFSSETDFSSEQLQMISGARLVSDTQFIWVAKRNEQGLIKLTITPFV